MPADFADRAAAMTHLQLKHHYATGAAVVTRWLAEAGIARKLAVPRADLRKPPESFAEHAHKANDELRAMFECSDAIVARWRKQIGVAPPRNQKPVPTDFAQVAPTMYRGQLQEHYGCAKAVLDRWLREAGVSPRTPPRTGPASWGQRAPAALPPRPTSLADDAADHLRRDRWQVCKAQTRDPSAPDDLWIVGNMKMSTDEMMRMATKKGWRNPFAPIAMAA